MQKVAYIDKQVLLDAQSNCFDVGGRLLCAAENFQHLIKTGNRIPLKNPVFNYYNSFKFANSNDPDELFSMLIEHMKCYGQMKKRYQKQFRDQLIMPIEKNELTNYFQKWKNGLPDNYYTKMYDALEKLLVEKESEDYLKYIKDYENEIDILENQRDDFDPRNYMKYYPSIRYNNDVKEENLRKEMKNNRDMKVEMKLNKDYLDNPVNQKYENDLKNKSLDAFTPNKKNCGAQGGQNCHIEQTQGIPSFGGQFPHSNQSFREQNLQPHDKQLFSGQSFGEQNEQFHGPRPFEVKGIQPHGGESSGGHSFGGKGMHHHSGSQKGKGKRGY